MRSIIGSKQNNGLPRWIHGGVCQKFSNLPRLPGAPRRYLNNSFACLYVNFTNSPFRPDFSIEVDQTLFDRLGDPAFNPTLTPTRYMQGLIPDKIIAYEIFA